MIGCLLIYQTCYELFVNYNFLVLVWIWLHDCLSYDSRLGLVKSILYHINFITIDGVKTTIIVHNIYKIYNNID
jgi:hypothetical protein